VVISEVQVDSGNSRALKRLGRYNEEECRIVVIVHSFLSWRTWRNIRVDDARELSVERSRDCWHCLAHWLNVRVVLLRVIIGGRLEEFGPESG
jgi:hypothetical protein